MGYVATDCALNARYDGHLDSQIDVTKLEQQFEKELPWRMIPPSEHQGFKLAEEKQIQEHLVNKALTPLSLAESMEVERTVPAGRIPGSR